MNITASSSASSSAHRDTNQGRDAAGLSTADRGQLRTRLIADAARSSEQAAALSSSFEAIVEAAELVNTDDEHDPEGTTIAFERAQVLALQRQAEADLEAIEEALLRLDDEGYGMCTECGAPIGLERLVALPASTHCIVCA